jgi:hypothetical protein
MPCYYSLILGHLYVIITHECKIKIRSVEQEDRGVYYSLQHFSQRRKLTQTYVLNHLLNSVLLEKLVVVDLINKFAPYYGIKKFIIVFGRASYWTVLSDR